MLVVLDDAREAEQVRAFLPTAPGSVVLVTSDRSLTSLALDGAEFEALREFSEADGIELLSARCGDLLVVIRRQMPQSGYPFQGSR